MSELVAIDLGGTHVRFALAEVAGGKVVSLGEPVTLKSADYDAIPAAWAECERVSGVDLPKKAALSVAGPAIDGAVKLTNLPWRIERARLERELVLDRLVLVNDFEAVGHAVAQAGPNEFQHLCGPDEKLPDSGAISIVGPGTGLGVAILWRGDGDYRIVPSEGGHIGFAPVDAFEDRLLETLRRQFGRVSVERVAAGPGISDIYQALGGKDGPVIDPFEDKNIWTRGTDGHEQMAEAASSAFARCWAASLVIWLWRTAGAAW